MAVMIVACVSHCASVGETLLTALERIMERPLTPPVAKPFGVLKKYTPTVRISVPTFIIRKSRSHSRLLVESIVSPVCPDRGLSFGLAETLSALEKHLEYCTLT